jgi:hypothetical protein
MRPHDDVRSRALRALSIACVLCGTSLLVIAARPAPTVSAPGVDDAVTVPRLPVLVVRRAVRLPALRRDPFAVPPAFRSSGPGAARRVLAVMGGSRQQALVEEDGRVRLVAPGDRIGGLAVTAIDAEGVHLEDGSTLTIAARGTR